VWCVVLVVCVTCFSSSRHTVYLCGLTHTYKRVNPCVACFSLNRPFVNDKHTSARALEAGPLVALGTVQSLFTDG